MNNYKQDYLRAMEILIHLENEGKIKEEWKIENYCKTIEIERVTPSPYDDVYTYEIPVDEFISLSDIENILKDDYSEFRI